MIVDASVAVKWLIEEDGAAPARALVGRIDLLAPTLVHAEVANAIWKKQRRGEFAPDADLSTLPQLLASMVLTIDETPMMPRALAISIALDHPVYDCVYLAVAEAMGDRMMTADRRFAEKAMSGGHADRIVILLGA